jgi:DnaK suppressor protein
LKRFSNDEVILMKATAPKTEPNRKDKLCAMLIALRDETYERVRELRKEQGEDAELEPGDEMDQARATGEVETHASLIARAEEGLRYIDEALGRAEKGYYGICAGCSQEIPIERLRALPFAIYCVDCQQKRRAVAHGWTDGGTIQPYDQQWTLPEAMEEQPEPTSAAREVVAITGGEVFAEGGTAPKTKKSDVVRRLSRRR